MPPKARRPHDGHHSRTLPGGEELGRRLMKLGVRSAQIRPRRRRHPSRATVLPTARSEGAGGGMAVG